MLHLLSEAGRSFLRAFGGSILIFTPGVLAAPNLNSAKNLGVAALIAAIAAGLKAVQVFVPELSFRSLGFLGPYYVFVDSFARAFLATLITTLTGILGAPDLSVSKSLIVAVLVSAATAGLRALQGLLTKGDVPKPAAGLDPPATPAVPPAR